MIVVERRSDYRWTEAVDQVVTLDELAQMAGAPGALGRRRVINLCRNYDYLGAGYYASLLAEARGDRVMPDVKTIVDLHRKDFHADRLAELSGLLANLPEMPRSVDAFSVHFYFGQAEDEGFASLAERVFRHFRCPLVRLDLERADPWRIVALEPVDLRDVPDRHDAIFSRALAMQLRRRWQEPAPARAPRFELAVLYDPDNKVAPSTPATLEHLIEIGRQMGVDVELIRRKDYGRLPQFDGLFIRETTAVPHHTFRFARRAEREGMPVIDDTMSILRCANKVFLAELLRGNGVATPATKLVTKRSLEGAIPAAGYPVVLKIPDGSFSRGVKKATNRDEFRAIAGEMLRESDIILVQEFVRTEFDWRVGVLDGEPLFAARYFMLTDHWQILKHQPDGTYAEGPTRALRVADAPAPVIASAVRAARLIGRGLYGVDLKETPDGVLVMEVNDNPNLDLGQEDSAEGDDLYRRVLGHFLKLAQTTTA